MDVHLIVSAPAVGFAALVVIVWLALRGSKPSERWKILQYVAVVVRALSGRAHGGVGSGGNAHGEAAAGVRPDGTDRNASLDVVERDSQVGPAIDDADLR